MDLAKTLVGMATTPVKVGLAAAEAGLDVAKAGLELTRSTLGETGVPTSPNSVAQMLGLEDAVAQANKIAALLDDDAPLGRALAPDGPLDRLMRPGGLIDRITAGTAHWTA